MNSEELERLIRQGENQEVEFRWSISAPQGIAKHLAAFANTSGGVLILGVKEPGQVVGVDEQRARAAIESAKQYLSPVPEIKVQALRVQGHPVVFAQVAASEELHSALGGYFGRSARAASGTRRADATRPMTPSEILVQARKGRIDDAAMSRLAKAVADQTKVIEQQAESIEKLSADIAIANSPFKKIMLVLAGALAGVMFIYFLYELTK